MTERDIITLLVNAMIEAQHVGCVDHLDCCGDGGKFWHVALHAGEAYLKEEDVSQSVKDYESWFWSQ